MAVYRIKKKRSNEEHLTQSACVDWFGLAYPKLSDLLFAIPNGGHRHLSVAKELKKEGVKRGVPDLFFAYPCGKYSGLFIEMKSRIGRASDEQKRYLKRLSEVGYKTGIAKTTGEFITLIKDYLNE